MLYTKHFLGGGGAIIFIRLIKLLILIVSPGMKKKYVPKMRDKTPYLRGGGVRFFG